ncbi:MAG: hypothetical protein LUE12_08305 [Ruminococcus sp.]|nr:hypothetical protein [Ruminococcus sp.]
MKLKRLAAACVSAIIALTTFASCSTSISQNEKITTDEDSSVSATTELSSGTDSVSDTSSGDSQSTEVSFENVEVPYVEYSKTYQAESGMIIGDDISIKKDRASFKGDGYISGATLENWSLSFDLPESQFYNITVMTAADSALNSTLYVNGEAVWIYRTTGDGVFAEKTLSNIWLEEGINEITIESTENAVDIDYVKIEASDDVSSLDMELSDASLSNDSASYRAQALYSLLCSDYGNQVLTAQHDTAGTTAETDAVKELTSKYPAIRVSDIGAYTKYNVKDISKAIDYFENGGIVAYDWYWIDPSGDENSTDIEISEVDFDITNAMPEKIEVEVENTDSYADDLDEEQQSAGSQAASITQTEEQLEYSVKEMAMWDSEQIEYMYSSGEISEECYLILQDIDTISAKLSKLKEEKVPVIWRPLPVASNGLYWWGTDEEAYIWLWQLMYTRMTEYHELNNLIWVWSAQNADWYVGDEYCDVISADIYTDGDRSAQINTLLSLNNICKTKPIAISECGNLPAMESILQENAFWCYTALYSEPYLSAETGLDETDEDTAASLLTRFVEYYNNNYTLTLEELPDIVAVAKSIKSEAESD